MNRLALSAIALLLVLLGLTGWVAKTEYDTARVLRTENAALMEAQKQAVARAKQDRKVLVARQAKIASKQRELKQAQEALAEALQRNKAWSDTDVPDDVQKALQGRSDGPDSGPAGVRHPD